MKWLLLLLVTSYSLWGQTKEFKGQIVLDGKDFSPEGIYIKNSNSYEWAVSDLQGRFIISVAKGDTLTFSGYNVEERKLLITDYFMKADKPIIHLASKAINLAEVRIWHAGLTGYLDEDLKRLAQNAPYDPITPLYTSLGVNPDKEPMRSIAPLGFGDINPLSLNLGRIADAISGDLRRRRALYLWEKREKKITEMREKLGDLYFTDDLDIPENKIRDLIDYALALEGLKQAYERNDYFEIMRILKNSAKILNQGWKAKTDSTEKNTLP